MHRTKLSPAESGHYKRLLFSTARLNPQERCHIEPRRVCFAWLDRGGGVVSSTGGNSRNLESYRVPSFISRAAQSTFCERVIVLRTNRKWLVNRPLKSLTFHLVLPLSRSALNPPVSPHSLLTIPNLSSSIRPRPTLAKTHQELRSVAAS